MSAGGGAPTAPGLGWLLDLGAACDIFGLFFFFPCKVSSAMAEVAAPWLCCAGGSGETPAGRGGGGSSSPSAGPAAAPWH